MFAEALFAAAKIWKPPKCPSVDEWIGTSLAVQWLRLHPSIAGATGSVLGWGTEIPCAMRPKKTEKKKKETDECIKMWYIHAVEYYSATERIKFDTCSNTDRPGGHDAK